MTESELKAVGAFSNKCHRFVEAELATDRSEPVFKMDVLNLIAELEKHLAICENYILLYEKEYYQGGLKVKNDLGKNYLNAPVSRIELLAGNEVGRESVLAKMNAVACRKVLQGLRRVLYAFVDIIDEGK